MSHNKMARLEGKPRVASIWKRVRVIACLAVLREHRMGATGR